jgi:hypothetical protein
MAGSQDPAFFGFTLSVTANLKPMNESCPRPCWGLNTRYDRINGEFN